jgi:hypothetical protein
MHLRKEYQFEVMARCISENLCGSGTFLRDVCIALIELEAMHLHTA